MIPVVIESPFGRTPDGEVADPIRIRYHKVYLQACIADCIRRGEAPFASHGLYPGALNDSKPHERELGIKAGFVWAEFARKRVVYTDLGVTSGMHLGIEHGRSLGQEIEHRTLPEWRL